MSFILRFCPLEINDFQNDLDKTICDVSKTVPSIENVDKFQNPFWFPVATTVFIIDTSIAVWLAIGAILLS